MIVTLKQDDLLRKGGGKITVRREPHQHPVKKHRHEFFEIFVVLSGEGTHVVGNFRARLQAGDVGVINCRRSHAHVDTNQLNLVNIFVREDIMEGLSKDLDVIPGFHSLFNAQINRWREEDAVNRVHLSEKDLQQVSDWIDRLEEETLSNQNGSELIAKAFLTLIIAVVSRKYSRSSVRFDQRRQKPAGRILSWIEANLYREIRIGELAEFSGMSERSLQRYFTEVLHATPSEYVAQCRLRRAKEMLANSSGKPRIADVALACGFEDSNYFSAWFKKRSEFSPGAYREAVLGKDALNQ